VNVAARIRGRAARAVPELMILRFPDCRVSAPVSDRYADRAVRDRPATGAGRRVRPAFGRLRTLCPAVGRWSMSSNAATAVSSCLLLTLAVCKRWKQLSARDKRIEVAVSATLSYARSVCSSQSSAQMTRTTVFTRSRPISDVRLAARPPGPIWAAEEAILVAQAPGDGARMPAPKK
jgi:hypothetical protein